MSPLFRFVLILFLTLILTTSKSYSYPHALLAVEGASDSEALMRLSTEDWLEALFHLPEGDIMMYREDCGRDKQFGPVTITASTPVGTSN